MRHVLTASERDLLREAIAARDEAIQVDDFAPDAHMDGAFSELASLAPQARAAQSQPR